MNVMWDDIFETKSIEGKSDAQLCGIALSSWGNCAMGEKPPNFGEVMMAIGYKLGIIVTPENLMTWAIAQGLLSKDE